MQDVSINRIRLDHFSKCYQFKPEHRRSQAEKLEDGWGIARYMFGVLLVDDEGIIFLRLSIPHLIDNPKRVSLVAQCQYLAQKQESPPRTPNGSEKWIPQKTHISLYNQNIAPSP